MSAMVRLSWGYVERFRPTIDLGAYPLEHMHPVIGSYFAGNVSSDTLTCFGNNDVEECSYMHTFICMVPGLRSVAQNLVRCDSLWGSRSVVVEVQGSVEFLRVGKLPEENNEFRGAQSISSTNILSSTLLTATRWLEIQSVGRSYVWKKEIKHIPSEPFYLCARSNHWQRGESSMRIEFRPSYFRENDYNWVIKKTLVHISLVVAVSSMWLLPYIAAMVTSVMVYIHGFDYYLIFLVFSGSVVCLTPFMFTKRNRHLAKLYLRYFFQRKQAREVRQLMRERRPLFQALYFSCVFMSVGSLAGFCIYSYLGIDRDFRNTIYKLTLAASAAWLAFFLCRTFEKFFRRWSWVPMTYALTLLLELHLNPMSKEEAVVAVIVITFGVEWFLVPRVDLNTRIGRDLRGVHWLERGFMGDMWTSVVTVPGHSPASPAEGGAAGGVSCNAGGLARDKPTREGKRFWRERSRDRRAAGIETEGRVGGVVDETDDTSGDLLSSSDFETSRLVEDDEEDDDEDMERSVHIDALNVETPPRPHSSITSPASHSRGYSLIMNKRARGRGSHDIAAREGSTHADTDIRAPPPTTPSPGEVGDTFNITVNVTFSPATTGSSAGVENETAELARSVERAVRRAVRSTP